MSNQNEHNDLYYDREKDILNFVEQETGLKKAKERNTLYISDYVLEDGKLNAFVAFGERGNYILKEYTWDMVVLSFYTIITLFTLLNIQRLIRAAIYVDLSKLPSNPIILLTIGVLGVSLWLVSTSTKLLSLTGNKLKLLKLTIFIILSWFMIITYGVVYELVIPFVSKLEITPFLSSGKIIMLAYILTIVPTLGIIIAVSLTTYKLIFTNENLEMIRTFKIKNYINLSSKNRSSKYDYDLSFFRDDMTGKKVVIKEHDRWMHCETIGATGSGKSSSILLPVINSDLDKKVLNEDKQKKLLVKWIKKGWCYLTKPLEDKDFSINYFKPNPGYEKRFEKEIKKYRSAGLTVMAPDDSLTDKVYDLCKAKKIKCNRIDARRNPDGSIKEGSIGFNPFYISPLTPEWRKEKEIIKSATLFADIMQIMYEMSGKSDPYFTSINRIATTTVAITLMLTYPRLHNNKQPTPQELEHIINDFSRIKKYYDELVKIDIDNTFISIRDTIMTEFLGAGREKFQDHCRGLRVQINNFLLDPEIKRILCSQNSIDLDKALRDGEVTVVNIELGDLGAINSPAFGLFFSIAFQNAVLSRPGNEDTRLPHFWTIDELPVLVSPNLETSLVLFRKFRVAMFLAMQTLDQFNKNPFLMYLKGIILNSCAHHFIFGRTNPNDGELISELGGMVDEITYQEGSMATSMLNPNPVRSFQTRYSTEKKQRITSEKQRELDFQEITYFTTRDGKALPPRFGKVYFLSEADKKKIKRIKVDWNKLMDEQTQIVKTVIEKEVKTDGINTNPVNVEETADKHVEDKVPEEDFVATNITEFKTNDILAKTSNESTVGTSNESIIKKEVVQTAIEDMDITYDDVEDESEDANKSTETTFTSKVF